MSCPACSPVMSAADLMPSPNCSCRYFNLAGFVVVPAASNSSEMRCCWSGVAYSMTDCSGVGAGARAALRPATPRRGGRTCSEVTRTRSWSRSSSTMPSPDSASGAIRFARSVVHRAYSMFSGIVSYSLFEVSPAFCAFSMVHSTRTTTSESARRPASTTFVGPTSSSQIWCPARMISSRISFDWIAGFPLIT